ncbi:MAG: hypothetical protein KBA75_00520 [Alphaproteobacteria bacterium]|nr:hypothetical protein [Alphaproteobacteria bacterium]
MNKSQPTSKPVASAAKPDEQGAAPHDKAPQNKPSQDRMGKSRWSSEGGKR